MNAVAVRKFCTLQEAAERLNTTEEQIEKLLSRGLLREFRDGPHRLLRTADVGAILAARTRRLERQGQPREPDASRQDSLGRDGRSVADPADEVRTPRRKSEAPQEPRANPQSPRTPGAVRRRRNDGLASPRVRQSLSRSSERSRLSDNPRRSRRRPAPEPAASRQSLSVREWFWNGLLQDSPIAIALLSAIAILTLSGVVAGACWLANTLR